MLPLRPQVEEAAVVVEVELGVVGSPVRHPLAVVAVVRGLAVGSLVPPPGVVGVAVLPLNRLHLVGPASAEAAVVAERSLQA